MGTARPGSRAPRTPQESSNLRKRGDGYAATQGETSATCEAATAARELLSSEPMCLQLSQQQLDALRTFAVANGARWKSKLNVAWATGRYGDYKGADDGTSLQQVRNAFGPSWLVKFSFDNLKTHGVQS